MPTITSSIGLATGMDIQSTVEALMKISAVQRDNLVKKNEDLEDKQLAVTGITASLLSVQYLTNNLGKDSVYDERSVASSLPDVLEVTSTGSAAKGTYLVTPLKQAQTNQLISTGFADDDSAIGTGFLRFRYGSDVLRGTPFRVLNGGEGFNRGKIQITDRSGTTAQVDLSYARTIDDVLTAINSAGTINVRAYTDGDSITLEDKTGQTTSNLIVREVGEGTTAESLGLTGINVAADTATGDDLVRLYADLSLDDLNDGNGVDFDGVFFDAQYHLADGTTGQIDFNRLATQTKTARTELTVGDVLQTINEAAPGKLQAELSADGDRIILTDLTVGVDEFSLSASNGSRALYTLGLDGDASGDTLTGRRLLGGLKSVLLSSLDGGTGLGTLGVIDITDRNAATDSVDLSACETLDDIVEAINASAVDVTATINASKTGIEIEDTSGGSGSFLITNGDATNTATALKVATSGSATSVNSGDLHLQIISKSTKLEDLNGGQGIDRGIIKLIDTAGHEAIIDFSDSRIKTLGDVLTALSANVAHVEATINETGDGITIRDLAGGSGSLQVLEGVGSTAARDLGIFKSSESRLIEDEIVQVIDGSFVQEIAITSSDTLETLVDKLNVSGSKVNAAVLNDGSDRPYRLAINSAYTGNAGNLVFEISGLGISLSESVKGQDALIALGPPEFAASSLLLSSQSNTFTSAVPGVSVKVKQATGSPVTVQVSQGDTSFMASAKTFVENYNKFWKLLQGYTAYNPETNKRSVLTLDPTAQQVNSAISKLMSGQTYAPLGGFRSLGELGFEFSSTGQLSLDENKLRNLFAANPQKVKNFFKQTDANTDEETGFSVEFGELTERLTSTKGSLLTNRYLSLGETIQKNQERIDYLTDRLDAEEKRLYLEFYRMEIAIAKMQNVSQYIDQIKPLKLYSSRRDSD